jgi:hypothetical protein
MKGSETHISAVQELLKSLPLFILIQQKHWDVVVGAMVESWVACDRRRSFVMQTRQTLADSAEEQP